jgi:hypothetical protein
MDNIVYLLFYYQNKMFSFIFITGSKAIRMGSGDAFTMRHFIILYHSHNKREKVGVFLNLSI